MTAEHTTESALRTRIAQLEADVLYVRGLAERASKDADKAEAQNKWLRKENEELIEALKWVSAIADFAAAGAGILPDEKERIETAKELLKKYEQ